MPDIKGKNYYIASHTDGEGSVAFNKQLSDNRSLSVQKFLLENGINPENIEKVSFGKSKPMAISTNEEGKKLNSRSKISVLKNFKKKLLRCKIRRKNYNHNLRTKVSVKNNLYADSVVVDEVGNFEIFIPVNQKIIIAAIAKDHYNEPLEIITKDEVFIRPLEVKVFELRENGVISFKNINFEGDHSIILPGSISSLKHLLQFCIRYIKAFVLKYGDISIIRVLWYQVISNFNCRLKGLKKYIITC